MKNITILLSENPAIVSEKLRKMLEPKGGLVIGEAQDGRHELALTEKLLSHVALMDTAMSRSAICILILSRQGEDGVVKNKTESGTMGSLLKQTSFNDVDRARREFQNGNAFFSPSIARRLREQDNQSALHPRIIPKLTSRELEVLQLVAEGKANKETASELRISIKTVEKHRQALMEKLGIHNTAGLTRYAIAAGIVEAVPG